MLVHQLMYQGENSKIAFIHDQKRITYSQFQKFVALYRALFYQHGVRKGENVGLFSKNSVEFIYSYLALTSLGAVVVPLNFQLVSREIAYIIQDAKIKILITMQPLDLTTDLIHYDHAVVQLIISDFESILADNKNLPTPIIESIDATTICTIIYTSGTTGYPKGAMLTHNNLISNARAFSEVFSFTSEENSLCILPMYHCFAWTCAVLIPLFNGATITIMDSFAIRETIATIHEGGVTAVYGIPTMFKLFAEWGIPSDFEKVKLFVSGGAALPLEILQQFIRKTGKNVAEGYGLSEASPVIAVNPVEKIKPGSVGKPLPGLTVKIINENGNQLLPGEIGELIVQGPSVMQGYYNLPEESAYALRNGWLHTGDLAYTDEDDYLFIVDRLKDMIITSGENIYPREIEEVLYTFPNVVEVAVIGITDQLRGQIVKAYIVFNAGYTLDKKALKKYLNTRIAAYKVPKEFEQVATLPRSATGKILKKELRSRVNLTAESCIENND